jgi:myo-inositol-1(or 4)-monophosphatase
MDDRNKLKQTAIKAARAAGKLLMERLGKQTIVGSHHNSKLNPITKEDEEAELKVIEVITSVYSDHGFLGEERGEQNPNAKYKWIIDPIDGTNNYVADRDTFSVSIGLEHKGKIILGVVYLPKRDEMFTAELGKGATLNGKKISINNKTEIKKVVVTMSSYPGNTKQELWINEFNKKILPKIPNAKHFGFQKKEDVDPVFGRGSMAAEFCYTACGRIDGVIRLKQKPWDLAAGALIAAEAGAVMTNLEGKPCSIYEGDYVASNPRLHKKLIELIRGESKGKA